MSSEEFSKLSEVELIKISDILYSTSPELLTKFCKALVEDLTRIERVRKYCNVELCKISVNYSQKVQIIAFDRTTPSIDKKRAKRELTKKESKQGDFMNKLVNGSTRFQHAVRDNSHLVK